MSEWLTIKTCPHGDHTNTDASAVLHSAICNAVSLMNRTPSSEPEFHEAHNVLRQALVDYADRADRLRASAADTAKASDYCPICNGRGFVPAYDIENGRDELCPACAIPAAAPASEPAETAEAQSDHEYACLRAVYEAARAYLRYEAEPAKQMDARRRLDSAIEDVKQGDGGYGYQPQSENPASPSPVAEGQAFGERIEAALNSYRMHHQVGGDGAHMPLVDVLTPSWAATIKEGQEEIHLLADHLYCELHAAQAPKPASADQYAPLSDDELDAIEDARDEEVIFGSTPQPIAQGEEMAIVNPLTHILIAALVKIRDEGAPVGSLPVSENPLSKIARIALRDFEKAEFESQPTAQSAIASLIDIERRVLDVVTRGAVKGEMSETTLGAVRHGIREIFGD